MSTIIDCRSSATWPQVKCRLSDFIFACQLNAVSCVQLDLWDVDGPGSRPCCSQSDHGDGDGEACCHGTLRGQERVDDQRRDDEGGDESAPSCKSRTLRPVFSVLSRSEYSSESTFVSPPDWAQDDSQSSRCWRCCSFIYINYMAMFFSLQMTCGLKELLLNGQSQETVVSLFPQLFSCLLVRLGASIGVAAGKQNNKNTFHVAGWECLHLSL